jgi:hypothetical protein
MKILNKPANKFKKGRSCGASRSNFQMIARYLPDWGMLDESLDGTECAEHLVERLDAYPRSK